jgi:hypothetical protein
MQGRQGIIAQSDRNMRRNVTSQKNGVRSCGGTDDCNSDRFGARRLSPIPRAPRKAKHMTWKARVILLAVVTLCHLAPATAQQKGQWVPGQFGLNAGAIPDPGVTYANLALNYSASQLNNSNGSRVPGINGTYSFWVDENVIYIVPKHKILGGYFMPYIALNYANGELVANITGTNLSTGGGGSGFADTFVEPINIGWHFGKRVDFNAGYAFTAPTGKYTQGANDNVGSGYWGNDLTANATYYITKNHGTTANLATAWEFEHGRKRGTDLNPGQAFTDEWGIGQVLPL